MFKEPHYPTIVIVSDKSSSKRTIAKTERPSRKYSPAQLTFRPEGYEKHKQFCWQKTIPMQFWPKKKKNLASGSCETPPCSIKLTTFHTAPSSSAAATPFSDSGPGQHFLLVLLCLLLFFLAPVLGHGCIIFLKG